jgi:hypothetical protein
MQICCKIDFDSVLAFKKAITKLTGFWNTVKFEVWPHRNFGEKPGLIKAFSNEPVQILFIWILIEYEHSSYWFHLIKLIESVTWLFIVSRQNNFSYKLITNTCCGIKFVDSSSQMCCKFRLFLQKLQEFPTKNVICDVIPWKCWWHKRPTEFVWCTTKYCLFTERIYGKIILLCYDFQFNQFRSRPMNFEANRCLLLRYESQLKQPMCTVLKLLITMLITLVCYIAEI